MITRRLACASGSEVRLGDAHRLPNQLALQRFNRHCDQRSGEATQAPPDAAPGFAKENAKKFL
jgi:hypothetical protein